MNNPKLTVSSGKMSASLEYITHEMTEEFVKELLRVHKITTGILWDDIKAALSAAKETRNPVKDICIASSDLSVLNFELRGNEQICNISGPNQLPVLPVQSPRYSEESVLKDAPPTYCYIDRHSTILRLEERGKILDVFGQLLTLSPSRILEIDKTFFAMAEYRSYVVLTPLKSGYLCFNENAELSVLPAEYLTEYKDQWFFSFIPVQFGVKELVDKIIRCHQHIEPDLDFDEQRTIYTERMNNLTSGVQEILAQGKAPVIGRNGDFKIHLEEYKAPSDKDRIDYKELHQSYEVKKDQLIITKNDFLKSYKGISILGKTISVPETIDYPLDIGEGIEKELKDNVWYYRAALDGVCLRSGNNFRVIQALTLEKDVDLSTGNIRFKGDVTVKGSVCDGFTVICAGNLTIMGSVEDNVEIRCGGDLYVKKGIIGHNTRIKCKKSAEIGLIQYASIKIANDLVIRGFAYNATVFSGNTLKVLGEKHNSKDTGVVIGGRVTAMEKMELHSVGGRNTVTTLVLGIDDEKMEELKDVKENYNRVTDIISRIQKKTGLDFSDPDLKKTILTLPDHRKNSIIAILKTMKEHVREQRGLAADLVRLENESRSSDMNKVTLTVQKHLIPPVNIQIDEMIKECKIERETFIVNHENLLD